ncbi:Gfo/Idh/MocA family protein [Quadrisphaera sp. INWT6]|uniref:Gfo/Idh/MocA family protein n=1 Tax=Quadrisphaera sp. INWT6 TaxID=2596917 RepID=UPI0018927A68|nr:Gfo/Idh/MocA family oxidoreductase [Quadrisphaera sp. INWT6]MBF5082979.1 Gfo/Idh/MocA family oxidoreductase [Quadrisphaera sp. INWT6]
MSTLRLAHVGLGGWGSDWERNAVPRVPEVDRVGVVEPNAAVLEAFRAENDLPDAACAPSLAQLLGQLRGDRAPEAVLITAPVGFHVPLALEALEAGLHVLVEKPFAPTVAEALTAVERAEQLGLVLQVSQNYRHYPAPRAVRRLLDEGALGEVTGIDVDFRQWANDAPAATHPHYRFPQPLLFDMAIHHFDLLRLVTGQDVVRVHAVTSQPPFSKFTEAPVGVLTMETSGGLVVSYRGSWLSRGTPTPWAGEWRVSGERGELAFTSRTHGQAVPPTTDSVVVRDADGATTAVALEVPDLWGRAAGLRQFARAVAGGLAPETSGRDNLASLAIAEAAARSAASGRVEEVVVPR